MGNKTQRSWQSIIATISLLATLAPGAAGAAGTGGYQRPGTTERVSVASGGAEGNGRTFNHAISADGRHVAFRSSASNLVLGDENGNQDVFVHDRETGATERVSVASNGAEGNGNSSLPTISPNGRHVAFESFASNLVPGDTNNVFDIFVHDRETGITERVSMASDSTEANGRSHNPAISADGRYVTFGSWASNLVPDDANGTLDVFVHDREAGATERVSVASGGAEGNGSSSVHAISADGRDVAFASLASNLVPGDENVTWDIFVNDRKTGITERVSVASDGAGGNDTSFNPAISADGRHVAFNSDAPNLVPGDTNGDMDVFVHDRETGVTERVSVASDGTEGNGYPLIPAADPAISADGRHVAFHGFASNLVPGDTRGTLDVFVHDRETGVTERVSVASDGTEVSETYVFSFDPAISDDGSHIAFGSSASNLVQGDANGTEDVFVRDHGPATGIGGLSIQGETNELAVSGWATFSGTIVSSAEDHADDGVEPLGAEIVGASVTYRPEQEDFLTRMDVASLPGSSGSCRAAHCMTVTPGGGARGVLYRWTFTAGETAYEVRALRAAAPTDDPYFALYECAASCTEIARLSGGIGTTGSEVRVSVPLQALEVEERATLTDLEASAAVGEAAAGALKVLDDVDLPDTSIPVAEVELGIAPPSAPQAEVPFSVEADLAQGRFSGTLDTSFLSPGAHRVWARACLGETCGAHSVEVSVATPTPTPTPTGEPTAAPTPSPSPSESPARDATEVTFTEDSASSGQYSDEKLFEARLTDSGGDPIEGNELTFDLVGAESSRSFTATTNEDGVASVTPRLEEKPGPYQLTVRYDGDDGHQESASTTSAPGPAPMDPQVGSPSGPTSALVHVRPETTLSEGMHFAHAAGADTGTTYGAIKVYVAYGTADTFKDLAKSPAIEYIEANRRLHYFTNTSHKATRGQNVLDGEVKLSNGASIDGSGVGVAVIDSGIDGTHPDLVNRLGGNVKIICTAPQPVVTSPTGGFTECLGPKQAVPLQDTDTPSAGGHGTHVAGIVAGTGAASGGTNHGAAPGATLYGVSIGTTIVVENALDGLAWVLENHDQVTPEIRVVNNSWGSSYRKYDPQNGPFHKATWKLQEALVEAGVSVVFAAGNSSGNGSASTTSAECINPTPGIVCVANYNDGGTGTRRGSINATSSRGKSDVPLEWPDISAPGTSITSTCRVTLPVCTAGSGQITTENNYRSLSGTSMAAPHVTGIIAQIYQADPTLTPAAVENHLEDTAHKFSFGSAYGLRADPTNPDSGSSFEKGHGLVDVVAVLNTILNEPEASPTPSSTLSATATPSPTPTGTPPGNQGSADTMSFVVDKEDTGLELTETKGKDKALVAHLYDGDTTADGIAGRTIDFYAGSELIGSAETDSDGVATFTPPRQKGKPQPRAARFGGDDFYLGASDNKESKGGSGDRGGGSGGREAEMTSTEKVLLM